MIRKNNTHLPFFTLVLLISFASVNAMLFTPALPIVTTFFAISEQASQYTITVFLVGYAFGQLLYGPLANRFGIKPALYMGIGLQIISSLICALSGPLGFYWLLVIGRFTLALGSSVGLKMTFTLINECYETKLASQKISYLMLAFAITPALSMVLGGFFTSHFGWASCFYVCMLYGFVLLIFSFQLPETQRTLHLDALKFRKLLEGYRMQFKNKRLVTGGLVMGASTSFIYTFSAIAPFITLHIFNMTSTEYGLLNLLPPMGLIIGSLSSATLSTKIKLGLSIQIGILITFIGALGMLFFSLNHSTPLYSLFIPMIIICCGMSFILSNSAAVAMSDVENKAQGSAVMNFINVGLATIAVLSLEFFNVNLLILPILYLILPIAMICLYKTGLKSYALK